MNLQKNVAAEIAEIAREGSHGRSFYLYDPSVMARKMQNLRTVLPASVEIYYAQKANPHAAFLTAARDNDAAGIEIASLGEGENALAAGFAPSQIIFTGPGKSPEELEWSVRNRIKTVHIESLTEAYRLESICREIGRTQDILVRVNPNFHIHGAQASFSGDSSKMGVDEDFFRANVNRFLEFESLNFLGLHVYAASGVLDVEDLIENCRRVFVLARDIEELHPSVHCDVIDFGGGFGIDYTGAGTEFEISEYAHRLNALIADFGFEDRRFVLELGRYLAADSGWYCTEIIDIKESLGKMQIICQGGAHHFRRPVALGINHPFAVVPMRRPALYDGQPVVEDCMAFIGGPLCNSADKLAPHDVRIVRAEIGDIAVFGLAGAYGLSMSHVHFLSHARPEEILLTHQAPDELEMRKDRALASKGSVIAPVLSH